MTSPHLAPAMLLAHERAAQLHAEAAEARRGGAARPATSRFGTLRRLVSRIVEPAWPTPAGTPQLRDYPYALG